MASFRKLKLVSEEELDRLKQRQLEQYEPKLRIMARVRNQVENLLNTSDESLTANERLRLLEMLQQRFRDIKSTSTSAKPKVDDEDEQAAPAAVVAGPAVGANESFSSVIPTAETAPSSSINLLDPDILKETIVSTISKRNQKEARAKLEEISSFPSLLSYNEKLEAVINGKPIPGSNYLQLFNSLYAKKSQSTSLTGYNEFQTAIGNIELAKGSSPALSSRLRSTAITSQTSSSNSPPPGTQPTVLRVYN